MNMPSVWKYFANWFGESEESKKKDSFKNPPPVFQPPQMEPSVFPSASSHFISWWIPAHCPYTMHFPGPFTLIIDGFPDSLRHPHLACVFQNSQTPGLGLEGSDTIRHPNGSLTSLLRLVHWKRTCCGLRAWGCKYSYLNATIHRS